VEASALPASAALARHRISIGVSLLRLRTDEQLVNLFRAGNDDAFRVIHDRYRQRLFVYARQMLGGASDDAEDALQEIFVRAYVALRANDRELALRAWLYRIAHNRCIDQLRRPPRPVFEDMELVRPPIQDPAAKAEQRDALRRLVSDVQRLPHQQRSALLMRELGGMAYADLAGVLDVSVPAVKSLLVRARVGLAQAEEARDTACASIREDVILSHDRGVRLSGVARRHMRECAACRTFRTEVRGVSHQFAALAPTLGPLGLLANFLGIGGGGGAAATASGGAAAGGGALAAGSGAAAGGGAIASAGVLATGAGHIVTLLAAAVVTAGGAVEVQSTLAPAPVHRAYHHNISRAEAAAYVPSAQAAVESSALSQAAPRQSTDSVSVPPKPAPTVRHRRAAPKPIAPQTPSLPSPGGSPADGTSTGTLATSSGTATPSAPVDGTLSPSGSSSSTSSTGTGTSMGTPTSTSTGTGSGTSSGPTANSTDSGASTSTPSAPSSAAPQPISGSGDPSSGQDGSPNSTTTGSTGK
jgi:RNA polymerase sigma factor (sigma-70 family)